MQRFGSASIVLVLASVLSAPSIASAQRRVQYDTLSESTPAAVSCGFCAGEKFGMVFRALDAGGGLRPNEFPLTVNSVEVAVARTVVTGSPGTYTCMGTTAGGTVPMMLEVYAGETAPRGSIMAFPSSGPWAGETQVFAESAELTLSVETAAGTAMYDVMLTTVPIMAAVAAPNTYLRVVVTIPGGSSSASCTDLGLTSPSAVPLRDEGRIENNVGFIYAVGAEIGGIELIPAGWHWNESDALTDGTETGINGDWAIRLNITPDATPMVDAGTPMPDAGIVADASLPMIDGGTTPMVDSGAMPVCSRDTECAGGERCVAGACARVACTTASDCSGGMTCADGMCRMLCSEDSECRGGEVCDAIAGYCAPVPAPSDGCSCRAVGSRSSAPFGGWCAILAVLGVLAIRRRRA